jgi:LysR family glycine cleavage system transcriptional activator
MGSLSMIKGRQRFPSIAALQVLLAVAERGSTSAAAESIALSQSAVSKQLLGLEELIGSAAFERTPRGMVATEVGQIYIQHARVAIKAMEDAALLAARLKPGPRILRLQVPPIFGDRWLLPRFHSFTELYPEIDVQFTSVVSQSQSEVPDGAFQFVEPSSKSENSLYLLGNDVALVSAPSYFERAGMPERIDDLAAGVMLEHPQTPFDWLHFAASHGRADLAPRHTTRFGYYTMVIRAALAGQGMAFVPRRLITEDLANGKLVNPAGFQYQSSFGYYFTVLNSAVQSRSMDVFIEWLMAQLDVMRSETADGAG